jgi:hypothetical protein
MKYKIKDSSIYVASILFGLSWVAASVLWAVPNLELPVRILIGLVPAAFLVFQVILCFRYALGQDEVQKRIILEGLAIAFMIALPAIFVVGVIMQAGIHLPLRFLDGVYCLEIAFLIGYIIAYRRYR